MTIINKEVVKKGYLKYIRKWIKGWIDIPGGKHINGYTGQETQVDELVGPLHTFLVPEPATQNLSTD